ncbi:MAG: hypothetical protein JKX70_05160 [Phycisphaerales bacterium]|nr:hypothetical protein [Phycisphaerales bacterium]
MFALKDQHKEKRKTEMKNITQKNIQHFAATALILALSGSAHAAASPINEDLKLTADDAILSPNLAIFGTTAIIGAPSNDEGGVFASGSVYLFDTTTGQQLPFTLTAEDAVAGDRLGISVAISGTTAIVGGAGDVNNDDRDAGLAYLFNTTTGQQRFKLTASDADSADGFGKSVAISGTTAIIGAPGNDGAGPQSGSAYIYNTMTGEQLFILTADDSITQAAFGESVAISGTTAIVGARDNRGGSFFGSGLAYLFDTTTGQQLPFTLTADNPMAGDSFGESVAISGTTAIVGAHLHDGSGSAYLFNTTTGQQLFKLTASDAAAGDQFGVSVAISGTTAIIGAIRNDDEGIDSGSAYLFDTTTGEQLAKLAASDAAGGDNFGISVSISGTTVIVGARTASGSAYLFDTQPCPADLNCDGVLDFYDIPVFLTAFENMDASADFTGDSIFDFNDVAAFLALFAMGCP